MMIQFGGNKTNGDIAYALMMKSDFMGASENFKKFTLGGCFVEKVSETVFITREK